MSFFNTDEPTVAVRMIGHMSYGPTANGTPAYTLQICETHNIPQSEAGWLISTGLAELV
jgi:hypothetical protein